MARDRRQVDMSAEAIDSRLRQVAHLRNLCLDLGRAKFVDERDGNEEEKDRGRSRDEGSTSEANEV